MLTDSAKSKMYKKMHIDTNSHRHTAKRRKTKPNNDEHQSVEGENRTLWTLTHHTETAHQMLDNKLKGRT